MNLIVLIIAIPLGAAFLMPLLGRIARKIPDRWLFWIQQWKYCITVPGTHKLYWEAKKYALFTPLLLKAVPKRYKRE